MVQVVKWYLSAFHAGRKGSVAKKPYNPILGEIFRCHWVLPGTENEDDMVSFVVSLFFFCLEHSSNFHSWLPYGLECLVQEAELVQFLANERSPLLLL